MSPSDLYVIAGIIVIGIGLYRLVASTEFLRRVVALNIASAGAGAVLVSAAYREPPGIADPVPHALVITGIVVVVSTTAVALALIRRLHDDEDDD